MKHASIEERIFPKEKKLPKAKIKGEAVPEATIHRVEAKFNPKRNKHRYKSIEGKHWAELEDRREKTQHTVSRENAKLIHTPKSRTARGKGSKTESNIPRGIKIICHK